MNTNEHYWTLLNTIENYWTLLNAIEHYWTLLNTTEHNWTLLNIIEHCWTQLNTIEHYWTLLNTIELLTFMNVTWRTEGECDLLQFFVQILILTFVNAGLLTFLSVQTISAALSLHSTLYEPAFCQIINVSSTIFQTNFS